MRRIATCYNKNPDHTRIIRLHHAEAESIIDVLDRGHLTGGGTDTSLTVLQG